MSSVWTKLCRDCESPQAGQFSVGSVVLSDPVTLFVINPNARTDELLKPEGSSQIHRAELAQPLSTALKIALVRHFERLNIIPSAVVGHSSGEIAAAYASGYISLEYAITLAYYRGYVSSHGNAALSGGAMAAVGLGAADVSRFLQPGVCVACENSPSSTTISGDAKAVQKALASILEKYPEVLARTLKVDVAYHSRKYLPPPLLILFMVIN